MSKTLILAVSAVASLLLSHHPAFPSLPRTFLALTTLLFSALFSYRVLIYPRFLSPTRHIPTPPGAHWLLGHFRTLHYNPTGVPQLQWMSTLPHTGLIRYTGLFNADRIMPCSPKTLSEALHTKSYLFIKPAFMRNGVGRILGVRGILFSEGDEHRHQRKLLLPAFSHAHIKNLVPTFWSASRELVEKVEGVVGETGGVVEMARWCSLATLDIIGRAGFGYDFGALRSAGEDGVGGSELARAYNSLFTPTPLTMVIHVARLVLPGWVLKNLPFSMNRKVLKAADTVKRVSIDIISAKKRELAEKKTDDIDILSVMLKSGDYDGVDGVDIMKDQMMTFLAAGHETTATAMIWALHLLSLKENQRIQEKLRDEIRGAFPGGMPETVSYEQIEALKYLRGVTSEVLRFYPPVPLTARHAAEDTTLGGEFVPKGTRIVIVPWAMNRSTELWGEDADQFRPERWEEGQGESNYGFMTFLAGPRGCIGNVFAKVEYKCLLAALIGRFSFVEAGEGRKIVIKGGITSKPQGGIPLRVGVVGGW